MMIGIVVNFSEQHEARVRQSFLKLADGDCFEIRGPDRTISLYRVTLAIARVLMPTLALAKLKGQS
jgi:hypothetical protein